MPATFPLSRNAHDPDRGTASLELEPRAFSALQKLAEWQQGKLAHLMKGASRECKTYNLNINQSCFYCMYIFTDGCRRCCP